MLRPQPGIQAYLYLEPVDMRKSIDGLAILVESELALSPMTEALFVFCNRGRDKIKILYWERNGRDLNYLLDGFDIWQQRPHQTLHFDSVS